MNYRSEVREIFNAIEKVKKLHRYTIVALRRNPVVFEDGVPSLWEMASRELTFAIEHAATEDEELSDFLYNPRKHVLQTLRSIANSVGGKEQ